MNPMRMFGFGSRSILAAGCRVKGRVTHVHTCWYIKVNTKPLRSHALDGARFPHIIRFEYEVAGKRYVGRRFVDYNLRCPTEGAGITVHYDPQNPGRYAVEMI